MAARPVRQAQQVLAVPSVRRVQPARARQVPPDQRALLERTVLMAPPDQPERSGSPDQRVRVQPEQLVPPVLRELPERPDPQVLPVQRAPEQRALLVQQVLPVPRAQPDLSAPPVLPVQARQVQPVRLARLVRMVLRGRPVLPDQLGLAWRAQPVRPV